MIRGKSVTLRGLELGDVEELLLYWNNKNFMNYSGRVVPYSKEEGEDWVRQTWVERKRGKGYSYAIEENLQCKYIGNAQLRIINTISKRADISVGIFNPNFRNKGLGSEALHLLIEYAFNTLNLQSIELKVFAHNKRAITCYEKLGFKMIGCRRKADFIEGHYIDDLMMDILKEEWKFSN
ncbi:MAG: GNAT family N-acetyltransferase [Candidatus Heimdallarchaeota archaeon]|nr:MAG: GNAT family N-acetyltransferase [Candidatus Heimdallarchaeota archaeon]